MDHLPLPHNPASPPLKVPFVCTEEYDRGPFLTYPQRQGWQILHPKHRILLLHDGAEPCRSEKAAFIQTWIYFGLLNEAVGPRYKTACFIEDGLCGKKFLTAVHLERIIQKWTLYLVPEASVCDISGLVDTVHTCLRLPCRSKIFLSLSDLHSTTRLTRG